MLDKALYYALTFAESALSVVGIRATYEQPRYEVVERLPRDVEIRRYEPRVTVETDMAGAGDAEAFRRLFRYITGANGGDDRVAMTVPVEQGSRIAMTVPVEQGGDQRIMRFFLPAAVAKAGPPVPTEPKVRIARLPAATYAALRFSGTLDARAREKREAVLRQVLAKVAREPTGPSSVLSYDPPFAIPFLRRNEIVIPVAETP
ncbi:heme-binding protein [Methylobacterium sp. W2]|uniref:SOUL family heme-binding protein n=1 Tax=Methylobacterium sp. W2 TaxID=2598107 RepID=UPI001D0C24EF|nr:heme-binding protein [Methylobacterium sp. W2]MCC0805176.1 heme-binding protein [Methylobacterium sp. W2]